MDGCPFIRLVIRRGIIHTKMQHIAMFHKELIKKRGSISSEMIVHTVHLTGAYSKCILLSLAMQSFYDCIRK